jgi:hypothetical protein
MHVDVAPFRKACGILPTILCINQCMIQMQQITWLSDTILLSAAAMVQLMLWQQGMCASIVEFEMVQQTIQEVQSTQQHNYCTTKSTMKNR